MYLTGKETYDSLVNKKDKVDKIITKLLNVKQSLKTNLIIDNKIPEEELISTAIEKLHYCSNCLNIMIKEHKNEFNIK